MKAPKILAVASAIDLDFRYGCTPAWWQLWKGLYEVGVDLIVTPYRGAGRPEAIYAIERVIDIAAKQFGYDRIDLRRRNIIPPKAQPYTTPLGMTYDCGDYGKIMDRALALSDWKGFNKRKRESKRNKKLRGIGLANYLEITSGSPRECGQAAKRTSRRRTRRRRPSWTSTRMKCDVRWNATASTASSTATRTVRRFTRSG